MESGQSEQVGDRLRAPCFRAQVWGETGKQAMEGRPQLTLDPGSAFWTRLGSDSKLFLHPGRCLCRNPMWVKQVLELRDSLVALLGLTQALMVDTAPWRGPGQALPHTLGCWTRDQRTLHRDQARKSSQNMNAAHPLIQLCHFWTLTLQVSSRMCKMTCGDG